MNMRELLGLVQERRIDAQNALQRESSVSLDSRATHYQEGRYDAYWEVENTLRQEIENTLRQALAALRVH